MATQPTVYVVDDDIIIREALTALFENEGLNVQAYASAEEFLALYRSDTPSCLLLDIDMPGIDGLELQNTLNDSGLNIPIIFLTGQANVPKTIQAFRNKAFDFLEKPASDTVLLDAIQRALAKQVADRAKQDKQVSVEERLQRLTPREKDVYRFMVSGYSNKRIGEELEISTRTVEGHRRRVYEKMQAGSLAILIEMAYVAGLLAADDKV